MFVCPYYHSFSSKFYGKVLKHLEVHQYEYRKHRDSQELRDQDMPSYYGDEPDDVNYNEITVLDDVVSTSGQ